MSEPSEPARVTYIGHATTLIEMDGSRLITDPVLRGRIGHIRRIAPRPRADLRPDAILISHAHRDHLDLASLRALPAQAPVIAPPGVASLVQRRTGRTVISLDADTRTHFGRLEVLATDATHDGRRWPGGPDLGSAGFVVAGSACVYFAGDTDVVAGMAALAGDIDLALLPVWGWGPRVGPGHLDPERAARAAALLQPRTAVPVHWGTFAAPRVWWRADPELPAREFRDRVATYAPHVTVRILAPGQTVSLGPPG